MAPRHEMDDLVIGLCADLLGTSDVGIADNFFELGGHSLLVTQLVSRLQRALQVPVSLRLVFESRSLAELSDALVERVLADADDESAAQEG